MTDTLDKLKKAFAQTISTTAGVQPWNEPLTRRDSVQSGQVLGAPVVQGGLGGWVGSSGFPYSANTPNGVQLGVQPPSRNSFEMSLGMPGVPDVDFVPYAANTNRFGGKGPSLLGHPISWEVVGPTLKSPYCDWQWEVNFGTNTLTLEAGPYPMPGAALPASVSSAYGLGGSISTWEDSGGLYALLSFTGENFTGALTGRTPLTPIFKSKAPFEIFRVDNFSGLQLILRSEKLLSSFYGGGTGCRAITLIRPKVARLAALPAPLSGSGQANRTFVFLPPERSATSEYMPPETRPSLGSWTTGGFDVTGSILAGEHYGTASQLPVPKPLVQISAEIRGGGPYAADEWVVSVPTPNAALVAGRIVRVSNLTDTIPSGLTEGAPSNVFGYFEIQEVKPGPPDDLTLRRVVEADPLTGQVFYGGGPYAIASSVPVSIEVYDNISSIFSDSVLNLEKLASARLTNLIDPRTSGASVVLRDSVNSPVVASKPDRAIFDTRVGVDPGNLLDLGFRAVFFPAKQLTPGGVVVPDFDKPIDSNDVILDLPVTERQFIEVDYASGVAYLSHTPDVANPLCEVSPNGLNPILTAPNNPRKELVLFGACVPYSMEAGQTGSGIRVTGSSPLSLESGFGDSDQADIFGQRIITSPNSSQVLNPVGLPSVITNLDSLSEIPPSGFFFVGQNVGGDFQNRSGPYNYQYTTLVGAPLKVQLNGVTGPSGAVILDPGANWKIVLQRTLRSFEPQNSSSDTVRGSSKKVSTLAFKNSGLSFGADGTVTIEPRVTLQQAYEAGNLVNVTAAQGPLSVSNVTDTTTVLSLSRSNVGAGSVLSIAAAASATGSGITINQAGVGSGITVSKANSGSGLAVSHSGPNDAIVINHQNVVSGTAISALLNAASVVGLGVQTTNVAATGQGFRFSNSGGSIVGARFEMDPISTGVGVIVEQRGSGDAIQVQDNAFLPVFVVDNVGTTTVTDGVSTTTLAPASVTSNSFLYPSPGISRTVTLSLVGQMAAYGSRGAGLRWDRGGANDQDSRYLVSTSTNATTVLDLNQVLPEGATILDIQVRVNGTAAGIEVELNYVPVNFAAVVAQAVVTVAANLTVGSGWVTISLSPFLGAGYVFTKTNRDHFLLFKSNGTSPGDEVHGCQITYLDPGPRNH